MGSVLLAHTPQSDFIFANHRYASRNCKIFPDAINLRRA